MQCAASAGILAVSFRYNEGLFSYDSYVRLLRESERGGPVDGKSPLPWIPMRVSTPCHLLPCSSISITDSLGVVIPYWSVPSSETQRLRR